MGRRRRSGAESRELILEAAKELLIDRGPARLTLDEVAEQVGVSRQAVLHHFGSRNGLMREVVKRAWLGLFQDLEHLSDQAGTLSVEGFIELLDEVTRRRGNARLGAWLLLSNDGLPEEIFQGALASLSSTDTPTDERYVLLLLGAALFGDAIFGTRLRQALALPDGEDERAQFRAWLAHRIQPLLDP